MSSTVAAPAFATVPEALEELRAGRMVVVVDDADRENEGDLTLAAEHASPAAINFMARHGRGLICVALTPERLRALAIPLMTRDNTSQFGTAFCESVDARSGVTTGISAADRARSIQALVDDATQPADLARPGHTFPLQARPGGVLSRAGQTEAAVDLARLAGLKPAGVICEIMNEDGTMARVPQLEIFCRAHGLKMITVADLIRYRLQTERQVVRAGESAVMTAMGRCQVVAYRSLPDQQMHTALVLGAIAPGAAPLVRVQSYCLLGALGSRECACAANLQAAQRALGRAGAGVLVLLHQNGPGYALDHGAVAHAASPAEQEERDLAHAPAHSQVHRSIGVGAQILADLGLTRIRVLTDHPRRLAGLEGYGLTVAAHVPLLP